ncbi:hypothetical protein PLICRDRAFT_174639 [Plicaturopsis crispa FD-325 SS-3]|nr:hypothetical protein PLICRDRAFT_174639 [Plicaturopsis crispa FD-325 SS-3]
MQRSGPTTRSKKPTAPTDNSLSLPPADGTASTPAEAPKKRARAASKDSATASAKVPPAKKIRKGRTNQVVASAEAGENVDGPAAVKPEPKKRAVRALPPRDEPLPERTNRNVHPGVPVMPRAKRTSAQVAADKREHDDIARQIAELEEKKMKLLATMELAFANKEAEEQGLAITHISQAAESTNPVSDPEVGADALSDVETRVEGTDTDLLENPRAAKVGSTGGENIASANTSKKKGKAKRGETRAAVEAIKQRLQKATAGMTYEEARAKTDEWQATISKKGASTSGLVSGWEAKASKAQGHRTLSHTNTDTRTAGGEILGGLADEDINAARPNEGSKSRANELISFVNSESQHRSASASRPKPTKTEDHPSKATLGHLKLRTTSLTSAPATPSPSGSQVLLSSPAHTNADVAHLPEFARAAWSSTFLPTLYAFLAASDTPWSPCPRDQDLVAVFQEIVDACWPGTNYVARNRLYDKRSWIGRSAVKVVKQFFKQPNWTGNTHAIAVYAQYASRADGPGLFGVPAPIDSAPGDENYTKPTTIFESSFILDTLHGFLKFTKNARRDYGRPKGALALSAAAVERAFRMFHSGTQVDIGQFSKDTVGVMTSDYMTLAKKLTARRWGIILPLNDDASGITETPMKAASTLSLQQARRDLYEPSSPLPEDSD